MAEIARQHWSAARYAETAHFVPALGATVLELLAPSAGEQILDLGCGDGVLTEKILAAGAIVVAVDAGPDMVAAARARGIDARVMDGQKLTFANEFDAVFSNAALHWMRDQEAVLAGVHRALKPRARFVAEMGGHNNTAAIMVALSAVLARHGLDAPRLSPWYFLPPMLIERSSKALASPSRRSLSSRGQQLCPPGSSRGSTPLPKISSARCQSRTGPRHAPRSLTCCGPC